MKTQLLEDIGQSANLSLVPSDSVVNSGSSKGAPDVAQAPAATLVKPRSAFGVWRQKPEGEPVVLATQQPDQPPPPPQPVHEEPPPPDEPAPQGPVFDFTPPPPATPAPDLVKHEPSWFERSGRRYMLWGSCMLACALLVQGGWWLYEQHKDAGSLALVADELKAEPQVEKAVKRRTLGAKEFTLGPDGEVHVAPAAPPSPPPHASQAVPPLVLLDPEPVAQPAHAAPLPKPMHRTERLVAATKPVRTKAEPVPQPEKKAEPESEMSATLKACREHGYHAAQCVERKCSVTKYGFVCRGE